LTSAKHHNKAAKEEIWTKLQKKAEHTSQKLRPKIEIYIK
jgi:hypothetical protein